MTFSVFTGALKNQLDHDASYQEALERMTRYPPGAATIDPMRGQNYVYREPADRAPREAAILPDPPGAQRRSQSYRPRALLPTIRPENPKKEPRRTNQMAVLEWLEAQDGPRTMRQITEAVGKCRDSCEKSCRRLRRMGLVEVKLMTDPGTRGCWGEWLVAGREWPA